MMSKKLRLLFSIETNILRVKDKTLQHEFSIENGDIYVSKDEYGSKILISTRHHVLSDMDVWGVYETHGSSDLKQNDLQ